MAGIESIIAAIESETAGICGGIRADAEKEAETAIGEAVKAAASEIDAAVQLAHAQAALVTGKAESAAKSNAARTLLAEKVGLIERVFSEALNELRTLDAEKYADIIYRLAARYALPESGAIRISEADLNRLPADFEEKLNASLSKDGAKLAVEAVSDDIGGGCVLCYGDIMQNCTFEALLNDARDTLSDEVNKILFR